MRLRSLRMLAMPHIHPDQMVIATYIIYMWALNTPWRVWVNLANPSHSHSRQKSIPQRQKVAKYRTEWSPASQAPLKAAISPGL